jgi:hypothetical protein
MSSVEVQARMHSILPGRAFGALPDWTAAPDDCGLRLRSETRDRYFLDFVSLCDGLHVYRWPRLISSAKGILEEQIKLPTKQNRVDGGDHDGHRSGNCSCNGNC